MSMKELLDIAEREKLTEFHGLKKQDLIFRILKERTRKRPSASDRLP